jgi:hypothetical protein
MGALDFRGYFYCVQVDGVCVVRYLVASVKAKALPHIIYSNRALPGTFYLEVRSLGPDFGINGAQKSREYINFK